MSKCVGRCRLENGVCTGCGRTIEEIKQAYRDLKERLNEVATDSDVSVNRTGNS